MKKIKLYLVVSILLLATGAVFAGKYRFISGTATNLYFYDGNLGGYYPLVWSAGSNLEYSTNTVLNQVTINLNNPSYSSTDGLYYYCSGCSLRGYFPVYLP